MGGGLFFLIFLVCVWDIRMVLAGTVHKRGMIQDCSQGNVVIHDENRKIKSAIVESNYDNNIKLCQILIEAKDGYRVRAIVDYFPAGPSDCQTQYIHLGNDRHRLNKLSLTSYKYCNKTASEEIVSRKTYLWIIYTTSENLADFRVDVSAQREVTCREGQFQCSPVQCVEEANVCDRIPDCENGRDEYCVSNTDVDQPCFQCTDGTCIRPTLPRYHDNWGKSLWYLCDHVKHCKDATDERPDICNNSLGRRDKVITCRPQGHPGRTKIYWKADVTCQERGGCELQQGERLCSGEDEESNGNGLFVPILIVAISVIVIATGFCVVHKMILLREKSPQPNNTETQLPRDYTTTDLHDELYSHPEETSSLASLREDTSMKHSHHRFGLCHGGRPSLDTTPEEKQCFISTV